MLTEEEKKYFEKSVKEYRFLSKVILAPLSIPVAMLIYCCANPYEKDADALIPMLITGLVLFVAGYVGYMSLRIKGDIFEEIVKKPGFDEQSKSQKDD